MGKIGIKKAAPAFACAALLTTGKRKAETLYFLQANIYYNTLIA
jgi:hypothetical protein